MPVSKKRKKDGRPVHRARPAAPSGQDEAGGEQPPASDRPSPQQGRMGRPSNPFVVQQQGRRGAQRGR